MNNGGRNDEPMVCAGSWIGPDGGRRSESVQQLWRPVSGCRRCRVDQCGAQFIPTKIIVFPIPVEMDRTPPGPPPIRRTFAASNRSRPLNSVAFHNPYRRKRTAVEDFDRHKRPPILKKYFRPIPHGCFRAQEQLADIIGGGLKSVARYESGRVCRSKGLDNLLRILDACPETLKIIQKKERAVKSSAQVVYIEDTGNKSSCRLSPRPFSSEIEDIGYGT